MHSPAPIAFVIGTRPEAIKMAPVLRALEARGRRCALVCTGQHPTLDLSAAGIDRDADSWLPLDAYALGVAAMCDAIEALAHEWLCDVRPALVVVQGDTNSALGAARAAYRLGVPIAHVEAGLRTFDMSDPWPEERNRIEIDAMSDLLFAPTPAACDNLRAQDVRGRVILSGNSGIDAVLAVAAGITLPAREPMRPMILATVHRRENRGAGIVAVGAALRTIAAADDVDIVVPLHPNAGARAEMIAAAGGARGISLIAPQSYAATVALMLRCDLILTDSGGLQEEAPALGRPVLILRASTERQEAIDVGSAILVGTDTTRIVGETRRLLSDREALARTSVPAFPFGTGNTGAIIADVIIEYVDHAPLRRMARTEPPALMRT